MAAIVKTSVNLTEDTLDALKDLAAKRGSSMAEVLRKAISTEKFLQEEVDKGGKILIQGNDKSTREIIFRG